MEAEFTFIYLFLTVAVLIAPLMTNVFFLKNNPYYFLTHAVVLVLLLLGIASTQKVLVFAWPAYCVVGLLVYLHANKSDLKSFFKPSGFTTLIPFVFSLIGATWLVSAEYDWQLLGYNKAWSYYACLHAHFLGWIFIGCLAFLAKSEDSTSKYFTAGCYVSFVSFLLIAFGIDGVPFVKPVGVVILSGLIPTLIALFFVKRAKEKMARFLTALSFLGVIVSLALALWHEFSTPLEPALEAPGMVSIHGLINAFIVVPAFYVAVRRNAYFLANEEQAA